MTIFRKLASWFSWLPWYRRRIRDADLARELRDHLELEAAEQQERGLSLKEASNAAHRALGNTLKIEEDVRAAWGFQWLETLAQDLRYGLRMLRKSPGFTAVAVLTLALGIGANTAIFSVIDSVLLSPLPYPKPLQLIAARPNDSLPNVIEIQRRNHSFLQGGAINVTPMDFTRTAGPVRIHAGLVNAGFLETLAIPPMLGRIISPDEDVEGGPRNIAASYQFWRDFLNGDPHALGRTVTLNGNSYSVIGVMPASFQLPREHADVFISLWVADPSAARSRDVHFLHPYWRLKPGVTLAHAQADILSIDQSLAQQYPDDERGRKTSLMPLHQMLVGDVRPALLVLFGAVGLVLLIACANFAGLLMARAATRRHELVIRAALGARRSRLIRQALTESGLLAIIGGVAGLLLAKWGTSLLLSLKPAALERFSGIQMDVNVLLFVFGVSMLTGVVFGLVPAWSAARADVSESLKESGRSATAGPSGHWLRKLLVTAEFAIALVLLVGAGLLIRGFSRLRSVNPGFNPANVMTMYLELSSPRYAKIPLQTQFRRELLARLNSFPGVEAAMISDIPFGGNYVGHRAVFDGRPPVPAGAEPMVQTLSVMGDYFHVMQIPIHEGRGFSPADRESQPLVAIVNEEFATEFFPDGSPLGHRIAWAGSDGRSE